MKSPRKYKQSVVIPVFGEIPLDPRVAFAELKVKEGPVWAQFFKYSLCGCVSVVVFGLVIAGFEYFASAYMSVGLPTAVRQEHLRVVLFCAFVPANLVAYFSNRAFVFTPGRHSFWREFWMFMFVSAISFLGGELGKVWMVERGFSNLAASGAFMVSSAMVNFIARKFLVFSR